MYLVWFFFKYTATTEIYTLSLHDALPISWATGRSTTSSIRSAAFPAWWNRQPRSTSSRMIPTTTASWNARRQAGDRKSTRLNSSHANISYAVFCLKKKNYQLYYESYFIAQ